jgi:hypothetical protein
MSARKRIKVWGEMAWWVGAFRAGHDLSTGVVIVWGFFLLSTLWLWPSLAAQAPTPWADLRQDFADPPAEWKTRPLWFWNAPPTKAETHAIMEGCKTSGHQGFGILPTEQMPLEFMSPVYLDRYEEAVEKAAELGMRMCLYDEFWFPSGGAGGQLAKKYPSACAVT